jgi:hypothetical protein
LRGKKFLEIFKAGINIISILKEISFNYKAMNNFTGILLLTALAFLPACEGEPGPPGRDGSDGESLLGSVFEIEGDFTPENDYSLYFEFPESLIVYESDIVLVYILWEQVEDVSPCF